MSLATVLSTKKLSVSQRELLLNAGLGFVDYDAITIEPVHFEYSGVVANAIFTSKNAVKAVLQAGISVSNCFCVGQNTKRLLEENGKKVTETAQNASDLAKIIAKTHKNDTFVFFCGDKRREELPQILKENSIQFSEEVVYKTVLAPKKFDRVFDGILFFSPSGVQSYTSQNDVAQSVAFCIGNTTASSIKKHTDQIQIANKPTVENVIVQAVKYFKNN